DGIVTRPRLALVAGGVAGYWLAASSSCSFAVFSSIAVAFVAYALAGGWRYLRAAVLTFPRDFRAARCLLGTLGALRRMTRLRLGIVQLFAETVAKQPEAVCFRYEDEVWTFRRVDEYSNRVANLLLETGHSPGQVVALFAESRPEFACLWLGMAKAGVVAALINYNLRAQSLVHCLRAAEASSMLFGAELAPAVKEVAASLAEMRLYRFGDGHGVGESLDGVNDFDKMLAGASGQMAPGQQFRPDSTKDRLFFIYTSGTTGLPKAAVISHHRFAMMANTVGIILNIGPSDSVYDCLPLYHTAGGILGVGQAFLRGATVVIRRKFSASAFWEDCVKYNCTVAQYIGELCRYLLAQPSRPSDQGHRLRLMFGNGLRPQIWREFQRRFGVKQMAEFYGATESNCNLINLDNTVGAVGFLSVIAPWAYPLKLVKVDQDTGEPLRHPSTGLCQLAGVGEPGELVGSIVRGDLLRDIDGYVSKAATEKKVLRNVLRQGDAYFSTGDVLCMDELGYVYFLDRTGDTFRWKGENVSTAEVEASISSVLHLADCTVYGVELPGIEGRAGMAAIVAEPAAAASPEDLLDCLSRDLPGRLPAYARPLFIRFVSRIESTGTFKMMKTELRRDGAQPDRCSGDPLFYLDCRSGRYLPLDESAWAAIQRGDIRF
ncbi:hypothetical protein BOX15_Mlig018575g1, partial [Macrostomum lignano]